MSSNIRDLEPQQVFAYFADLCAIPRISGHESAVGDYLMDFAAKHGLKAVRDEVGNVIIDKPASQGREDRPLVILQGHQDMVPAVRDDVKHDFLKDPIRPVIRDGKIFADGTTLGADDGLGVSLALALLADDKLEHGPLRAVFTVEEETTMKGAAHLDAKYLQGQYLINLDSDEDGYIFIASAGSQNLNISYFADERENMGDDVTGLNLELIGLSGGHSGSDIHLGRANGIMVLAKMLSAMADRFDFFYVDEIHGGTVRNAIPNQAGCTIAVPNEDFEDFKQELLIEFAKYRLLFEDTDPNMRLELKDAEVEDAFSFEDTINLISFICALPDGPERFFPKAPDVVETSCNVSVVETDKDADKIELTLLARSLSAFSLDNMASKVDSLCFLCDKTDLQVPRREEPWQSTSDNDLIRALSRNYEAVTGRKMQVTALHAGLETAAFAEKNPELQLASLGPTVSHPHSFAESCDIEAVHTAWVMLRQTLAEL